MSDFVNIYFLNNIFGKIGKVDFIDKYYSEEGVNTLNKNHKNIKKITKQSLMIKMFEENPNKEYLGYIIKYNKDKSKYVVYISELKIFVHVIYNDEIKLNSMGFFKFYLFKNEITYNQKVKTQLIKIL